MYHSHTSIVKNLVRLNHWLAHESRYDFQKGVVVADKLSFLFHRQNLQFFKININSSDSLVFLQLLFIVFLTLWQDGLKHLLKQSFNLSLASLCLLKLGISNFKSVTLVKLLLKIDALVYFEWVFGLVVVSFVEFYKVGATEGEKDVKKARMLILTYQRYHFFWVFFQHVL